MRWWDWLSCRRVRGVDLERAARAGTLAIAVLASPVRADPVACAPGLVSMARVDLFFGAAGPPSAWRSFLSRVVTPRFPDGLTVIEGRGQWRGRDGLHREAAHVLVVYYRRDASSDARIEAIRSAYKARFRQASVLRADSTACVGF